MAEINEPDWSKSMSHIRKHVFNLNKKSGGRVKPWIEDLMQQAFLYAYESYISKGVWPTDYSLLIATKDAADKVLNWRHIKRYVKSFVEHNSCQLKANRFDIDFMIDGKKTLRRLPENDINVISDFAAGYTFRDISRMEPRSDQAIGQHYRAAMKRLHKQYNVEVRVNEQ